MTVSQQRRLLFYSQGSGRQTKGGAMMNVGFGFSRGGGRCCQNWILSQSLNQLQQSPAQRRARTSAFASKLIGAELHIQIEPGLDWKGVLIGPSQSIRGAAEKNLDRRKLLEIVAQKRFKPLSAKRFFSYERLESKRMVQRANGQRAVRQLQQPQQMQRHIPIHD